MRLRDLLILLLFLLNNGVNSVNGLWDLLFPSEPSIPQRIPQRKAPTFTPSRKIFDVSDDSNILPIVELFNLRPTLNSGLPQQNYGPPRSFSDIFTGSNVLQNDYVLVRSASPSTVNPIPLGGKYEREGSMTRQSTTTIKATTTITIPTTTTTIPTITTTITTPTTASTTTFSTTSTTSSTTSSTLTTSTTSSSTTKSTAQALLREPSSIHPIPQAPTLTAKAATTIKSTPPKPNRPFSFVTPVSTFSSSNRPSVAPSSTPKRAISFVTSKGTHLKEQMSFVTPSQIDIISSNYKPPKVNIQSAIINSQGTPLHAKIHLKEEIEERTSTTLSSTTSSLTPATSTPYTKTTTTTESLPFVTPLLNEIRSYVTSKARKQKPFFVTPPPAATSTTIKSERPTLGNKYRRYTLRSSRTTPSLRRRTDSSTASTRPPPDWNTPSRHRSIFDETRRRVRKITDSSLSAQRVKSSTITSFEDLIVTKRPPNYRSVNKKRPRSFYRNFIIRDHEVTTPAFAEPTSTSERIRNSFTTDMNEEPNVDRIFHEFNPKLKKLIKEPLDFLSKPIQNVVEHFLPSKKKKKRPFYKEPTFRPSHIDNAAGSSTTNSIISSNIARLPSYNPSLNSFEQLIPSQSHLPNQVKVPPPSPKFELPTYSAIPTPIPKTTKNPFLRKRPSNLKPITPFINLGSSHQSVSTTVKSSTPINKPSSDEDNFVYVHYPLNKSPTFYSSEAPPTSSSRTRKPYVTISRTPTTTTKPFISNGHGPYVQPSFTTGSPSGPLVSVNPSSVTVGTLGEPKINNLNPHESVIKRPSLTFSDEYGTPDSPIISNFNPLGQDQANKVIPPTSGGLDVYGTPSAPLIISNIQPLANSDKFLKNYETINRNKAQTSPEVDSYGAPDGPIITSIDQVNTEVVSSPPSISFTGGPTTTLQTININPYDTTQKEYAFSIGNSDSSGTVQQTVNLLINLLLDKKNDSSFSTPPNLGSVNNYSPPSSSSPSQTYTSQQNTYENTGQSKIVQETHIKPGKTLTKQVKSYVPPPSTPKNTYGSLPSHTNKNIQSSTPKEQVVTTKYRQKSPSTTTFSRPLPSYEPPQTSFQPTHSSTTPTNNYRPPSTQKVTSTSQPTFVSSQSPASQSYDPPLSTKSPTSLQPAYNPSTSPPTTISSQAYKPPLVSKSPEKHMLPSYSSHPDKNAQKSLSNNYNAGASQKPQNAYSSTQSIVVPSLRNNPSPSEKENYRTTNQNNPILNPSNNINFEHNRKHKALKNSPDKQFSNGYNIPSTTSGKTSPIYNRPDSKAKKLKILDNRSKPPLNYSPQRDFKSEASQQYKIESEQERETANQNYKFPPIPTRKGSQGSYKGSRHSQELSHSGGRKKQITRGHREPSLSHHFKSERPTRPPVAYPTKHSIFTTSHSQVTETYSLPKSPRPPGTIKSLYSGTSRFTTPKPPIITPSSPKTILKSLHPKRRPSVVQPPIKYDNEDAYFDYYYDDPRDFNVNIQESTPIHIVRRPSPKTPQHNKGSRPTPKSIRVIYNKPKPNYSPPRQRPPSIRTPPKETYSEPPGHVLPELRGLLRPSNWDVKDFRGWEGYFSRGYEPKNAPHSPPGFRTTTADPRKKYNGLGIGFDDWIKNSGVESFGSSELSRRGEFSDIFGGDFAQRRSETSEAVLQPRTGAYYARSETSRTQQEVREPRITSLQRKGNQAALLKSILTPLQGALLEFPLE